MFVKVREGITSRDRRAIDSLGFIQSHLKLQAGQLLSNPRRAGRGGLWVVSVFASTPLVLGFIQLDRVPNSGNLQSTYLEGINPG